MHILFLLSLRFKEEVCRFFANDSTGRNNIWMRVFRGCLKKQGFH